MQRPRPISPGKSPGGGIRQAGGGPRSSKIPGFASVMLALHAMRRFDEAEAESGACHRAEFHRRLGPWWRESGLCLRRSIRRSSEGRRAGKRGMDAALRSGDGQLGARERERNRTAAVAQLIKDYGDVSAYQIAEVCAFRRENDRASLNGWNARCASGIGGLGVVDPPRSGGLTALHPTTRAGQLFLAQSSGWRMTS